MQMDVITYDDDTGVITLELDDEAKQYLIERGFNSILEFALKEMIKEHENDNSND